MKKTIVITAPSWIQGEMKLILKKYIEREYKGYKVILSAIGSDDSYLIIHDYSLDPIDPTLLKIELPKRVIKNVEYIKINKMSNKMKIVLIIWAIASIINFVLLLLKF